MIIQCDYPECKKMDSFSGQRPGCIAKARDADWYTAHVQLTKIKRVWKHYCPIHRYSWRDLEHE